DLADYLVRKGVPFRTSHRIVGELVRKALDRGIRLEALDMETLHAASDAFDDDIKTVLSPVQSTAQRNLYGGTGRESVAKQIEAGKKMLIDRKGKVVE
ncbi:MAG: argininosuccinate lyase, partial [Candidatus Latescibacteria bacterium]|nr:argininosuccinate lyase [Candidatus Latescibacterota bacterium]